MSQSLAKILVHTVFSTKERRPFFRNSNLRQELHCYITNQEQHHHQTTFQNEFRRLLERYEIEFDERYIWD